MPQLRHTRHGSLGETARSRRTGWPFQGFRLVRLVQSPSRSHMATLFSDRRHRPRPRRAKPGPSPGTRHAATRAGTASGASVCQLARDKEPAMRSAADGKLGRAVLVRSCAADRLGRHAHCVLCARPNRASLRLAAPDAPRGKPRADASRRLFFLDRRGLLTLASVPCRRGATDRGCAGVNTICLAPNATECRGPPCAWRRQVVMAR